MNEEMDALLLRRTWDLVTAPPGSDVVGCRWVFRVKYRLDGRDKALLVATGFTQTYEVDYFETPIARLNSICPFLYCC